MSTGKSEDGCGDRAKEWQEHDELTGRWVLRKCRTTEEPEDLFQNVRLRYGSHLIAGRPVRNSYGLLGFFIRDERRKMRRTNQHFSAGDEYLAQGELKKAENNFYQQQAAQECIQLWNQISAKLSPQYIQLLQDAYVEEYCTAELASKHGTTETAIRAKLSYIKNKIRSIVKRMC